MEAVAAMIDFPEKGGELRQGLLLHVLRSDPGPCVFLVAAQPEHIVDLILRKRRSEGRCRCVLRFGGDLQLFSLRGEQAELAGWLRFGAQL